MFRNSGFTGLLPIIISTIVIGSNIASGTDNKKEPGRD
jgi:hypothetical protein